MLWTNYLESGPMIYDIDDGRLVQQVRVDVLTVECCTCGAIFLPEAIDSECWECGGRLFEVDIYGDLTSYEFCGMVR